MSVWLLNGRLSSVCVRVGEVGCEKEEWCWGGLSFLRCEKRKNKSFGELLQFLQRACSLMSKRLL